MTKNHKEKKYEWVDSFLNQPFNPGAQLIIDRLKESSKAMAPVYAEIEKQVPDVRGRQFVLYDIVESGVLVVSNTKESGKNELNNLKELQKDISKAVVKLIARLDKHERFLYEHAYGVFIRYYSLEPYQNPLRLVMEAGMRLQPSDRRAHFREHVAPVLGEINPVIKTAYLKGNMPKLQEVLQVLKNSMDKKIEVTGDLAKVLLKSRKAKANNKAEAKKGKVNGADFVRLLNLKINESIFLGYLPDDFELSPQAFGTITKCAFGYEEYPVRNVLNALSVRV